MRKENPKFLRWVEMVSPKADTTRLVLTSTDWNAVLETLLKIFQILLGLGCFGRARVTRQVRNAMASSGAAITATELEAILSKLQKGN